MGYSCDLHLLHQSLNSLKTPSKPLNNHESTIKIRLSIIKYPEITMKSSLNIKKKHKQSQKASYCAPLRVIPMRPRNARYAGHALPTRPRSPCVQRIPGRWPRCCGSAAAPGDWMSSPVVSYGFLCLIMVNNDG